MIHPALRTALRDWPGLFVVGLLMGLVVALVLVFGG